jgi:glycosyltransferase involved in cell wall biosynthesis
LPVLRASRPKIMSYQREPTMRTVAQASRLAGETLAFTGCSAAISRQGAQAGGDWTPIFNAVDLSRYQFQSRVAPGAPLLFLSRVERIKGAHTAIAVAKKLGGRLVIAGNHAESGDEGRYWQEEVVPHLGRDGIEYIGPLDDAQKNEWLGQSVALLVPVEWEEPFGIVFAEAMACGTPVISCPRGALTEIVRSGVDGFLARDVEGLCKAVERIGSINRRECRARAETQFSVPVIVNQYEALYQKRIKLCAAS